MLSNKKILIIDDSSFERKIITNFLEGLNCTLFEAENATVGIKLAEKELPDLILMDVIMPGINGFQATKQLQMNESLKNIPVIMCTSKNQPTDKIWGEKQGAKAYLVKPLNREELRKTVSLFLGV